MAARYKERIVIDPQIMVGKPHRCDYPLVSGKEILEDYPNLTREDVQAALAYRV